MSEERLPRGMTPRLLNREQAAAYCGVGPDLFERSCPVRPVRAFGNRVLWDVAALDRWLDAESGLIANPVPAPLPIADRLNGRR